jgi:hypothetical protein
MTDPLATDVDGLLHEPTQVGDDRVFLTVDEVFEVSSAARIDFGGGELTDAELTPHERYWRNPDDDYQWWQLDAGQYVVDYNESLDSSEPVRLQPRRELLERGASHPSLHLQELPRIPLTVGGDGLHLKENARISAILRA